MLNVNIVKLMFQKIQNFAKSVLKKFDKTCDAFYKQINFINIQL